eukprot:126023-Prymnesium_polylepis.1
MLDVPREPIAACRWLSCRWEWPAVSEPRLDAPALPLVLGGEGAAAVASRSGACGRPHRRRPIRGEL